MNTSLLPAAVIAWLKNQGAQLLQAGRTPAATALEVGTVYEARVLQRLPHGRHLVQIGGQPMSLALPRENKPGDSVRLLYLRADPRPTFMLVRPEPAQGGRHVQVSEAASRVASLARWSGPPPLVAATPASPQAGPAIAHGSQPGSVPLTTSAAPAAGTAQGSAQGPAAPQPGQPVAAGPMAAAQPGTGQVSQIVAGTGATAPAPVAVRLLAASLMQTGQAGAPLLEQPSAEAQDWLAPLRQAVKDSGVFYEANLKRWVRGEQALEAIQRQPQARFADPAQLAQSPRVAELDGMPEEVARIAGRQLHMLEGQPFLWQGLAWPGQRMDWLIEERPGDGSQAEETPQWQTELRLTLPNLGGVAAEIVLQPRGLRLRLAAESEATQARMREALPKLANRLDAAGLTVLGLMLEAGRGAAVAEDHGQEAAPAG